MSKRNARSSMVTAEIEGFAGWNRDPYAAGVVPSWDSRFPDLPIVADGRESTGFSDAGRGTTGFDLFRLVDGVRADFLSVKTETIEPSGKLPSKLSLSTGNVETLQALIDGIKAGAALSTVVFCSKNGENGPETDGLALFFDLAPYLRAGIPMAPENGWGKGKAPAVYFKWSSRRKCGGKHKAASRQDLEFPHVDEQGRKWSAPDYVHYRELVVSLSAMGIKRGSWIPCNVRDLPAMVERQNWHAFAWGSDTIG